MAKRIFRFQSLKGGISDNPKEPLEDQFSFGRSLDFRTNTSQVSVLPQSQLLSTVSDLPLWAESACSNIYFLGDTGHIYQYNQTTLTDEYQVPDSVGNGLGYFPEDGYLYNASNTTIGRRSNACGSGSHTDAFLENEGGDPTNTKSLDLESSSSQYASVADNANQSITGDLTMEAWIKPESLPASGNEMVLISKWDENSNQRSYRFYIDTVSAFFGDGSDGALTISSNTTQSPIDSACSGTSGTYTLSATNASFAAGQKILIHQTRGSNAGTYQITTIDSYTSGTITTEDPLDISYNSTGSNKAQVLVLKQYTNVTVNSGVTWTAKAWNGTVGGILAFLANGTVTVTGTISADAKGFRGGSLSQATPSSGQGIQGEGTGGSGGYSQSANGNGGGGGNRTVAGAGINTGGGAGGGSASSGGNGSNIGGHGTGGTGGSSSADSLLTTMTFGGGGGAGGNNDTSGQTTAMGHGGNGGGIICLFGATTTITGTVTADGENGSTDNNSNQDGAGGGGGGGAVLVKAQDATLGSSLVGVAGGSPSAISTIGPGGAGSSGRIAVYYSSSVSGTTSPSYSSNSDSSLGNADGYALNLDISSDGTSGNSETYYKEASLTTDDWQHVAVKIDVSASTSTFYYNGSSLGTDTGALTSIDDSTASFAVGCDFNSSAQNFYDGLIDDVRLWNDVRTDNEILSNKDKSLGGAEAGLVSYYEFEDNVNDSHANANNLTASGSPTYSTDVPFVGVSTRGDEDVFYDESAQTYTLTTAINEGATHKLSFVPTKEPLKSIALNINTVGTGDWTVVVHDAKDRELTSLTVTNGELATGVYEFVFDEVSRPIRNATYHIHVYSTVADGIVVTGTASDFSDAYLKTYYQILVSDTYHPIAQYLNFLVIGNERYLGKLEAGNIYNPHAITLPSGYRIRGFAFWNDLLAVATWRGDAITDTDKGKVFFWDGVSDEFVDAIDVPQGGINAIFGYQGTLTISAGYEGKIMEWRGGAEARVVKQLPKIETGDYAELAPSSITMWRGLTRLGATLNTDSDTIHKGVYSYGNNLSSQPTSLGFDYPTSLGDQTSSGVSVGLLFPYGQKLYVGWQNINTYGIDEIDVTNDPYATATIEYPLTDIDLTSDRMLPITVKTSFLPLVSGQSVELKYKADRGSWQSLGTQSTTGADEIRKTINHRVRELQVAVDLTTNGSSLTVLETAGEVEDEQQSRRV